MRKLLFIIFVICLFSFWVSAQTRLIVRLSPEAVVKKATVSLGDIGQITGDKTKIKRLKQISLGYAPKIGLIREIPRKRIRMAIAATGFSAKEVFLEAPKSVRLRRAGQFINPEKIRETVKKAIFKQFVDNGVEARVVRLDVPENIETPLGKIDIRVKTSAVRNLFAPFSLPIEIRVNNRIFRHYSANVEIEAFAEVYVLAKDLASNTRIAATDVILKKRRLEKPLISYLRKKQQLKGIKTVRDMSKESELTSDSYVADIVVKNGDLVRIEGQSGRLKIFVNGKARASGRIGDRIAVKNLQSNKIIQAIIQDEGLVKVFF